jgi:hypothetical protein
MVLQLRIIEGFSRAENARKMSAVRIPSGSSIPGDQNLRNVHGILREVVNHATVSGTRTGFDDRCLEKEESQAGLNPDAAEMGSRASIRL